jgi:hypothetical protein
MTTNIDLNGFFEELKNESKKEGPEAEEELIAFEEHFKAIAERLIEKKLRTLNTTVILIGIAMFITSLLTYVAVHLKY